MDTDDFKGLRCAQDKCKMGAHAPEAWALYRVNYAGTAVRASTADFFSDVEKARKPTGGSQVGCRREKRLTLRKPLRSFRFDQFGRATLAGRIEPSRNVCDGMGSIFLTL